MQSAFDELYSEILAFRDYLSTGIITDSGVKQWCKKLAKPIKTFVSRSKQNTKQDIDAFIEDNIGQIYRFHETLAGVYGKTYMDSKQINDCRSPHDTVMQNVLNIKRPSRRFQHMPTKIFNKFVRGITYFASESVVEQPIYHRDASCGSANLDYITKFVNRSATADSLERCYIERLIYDAIYTTVYYKQDLGHLQELRNIERLYQERNSGITIRVEVNFHNLILPAELVIRWTKAWDKTITEIYSKNNNDQVDCKRIDTTSGYIMKYTKIQDFDHKHEWNSVD
jgi:hypothetical protein